MDWFIYSCFRIYSRFVNIVGYVYNGLRIYRILVRVNEGIVPGNLKKLGHLTLSLKN